MAGAQLADALQVAVGRDQDAVSARHRLEDECRDGVRPLVLDHLLEIGQMLIDWLRLLASPTPGVQDPDHARDAP